MAEPDKRQIGDGSDNYGEAAKQMAKAAKEAGKETAKQAAVKGAEAGANAAAATVQAGVEGGKAVAEIAAGTAAGGPWGAILSAAWAMRHTLFKILVCICLFFLVIIVLIVSLPSVVTNSVFGLDGSMVDMENPTTLLESYNDLAADISAVVEEGYDAALAKVEQIIEDGGYDYDLRRENRSRTIDKVAQRIRLNRTKLKSMQDTSTDYEELTNSIQAGYFIKNGIANYNEDLFYMSVFITVSAKTYEELLWRKQQMVDMLKSMDMYTSECSFQQEAALQSVMPFLKISPKLEKKAQRNVLTSGAASIYIFTSFELSDDNGVLLGINRYNNSLCIVDLFNTKINKNANLNLLGTSGAGKTFTMQLLALRMRMPSK